MSITHFKSDNWILWLYKDEFNRKIIILLYIFTRKWVSALTDQQLCFNRCLSNHTNTVMGKTAKAIPANLYMEKTLRSLKSNKVYFLMGPTDQDSSLTNQRRTSFTTLSCLTTTSQGKTSQRRRAQLSEKPALLSERLCLWSSPPWWLWSFSSKFVTQFNLSKKLTKFTKFTPINLTS